MRNENLTSLYSYDCLGLFWPKLVKYLFLCIWKYNIDKLTQHKKRSDAEIYLKPRRDELHLKTHLEQFYKLKVLLFKCYNTCCFLVLIIYENHYTCGLWNTSRSNDSQMLMLKLLFFNVKFKKMVIWVFFLQLLYHTIFIYISLSNATKRLHKVLNSYYDINKLNKMWLKHFELWSKLTLSLFWLDIFKKSWKLRVAT